MKIICLLGSPKGEYSVTRHYLKYIARNFPEHEFRLIDIGGRIKRILADRKLFDEIIEDVRTGDGVLWAAPVYIGSIPAQMKQFIEAVFADDAKSAFAGKYAISLVTSVNFFDHTALQYLHAVSEDLGLRHVFSYSGNRFNFPQRAERENLRELFSEGLAHIREKRPTAQAYLPLPVPPAAYVPEPFEAAPKRSKRKILLLTDAAPDSNLARMTETFRQSAPAPVETIHLRELGISGGCLGCQSCFFDGACVYRDGFAANYREKFQHAEAVVFAMTVKDRLYSAEWKMFLDRAYFNGHGPERSRTQVMFLVSGPLKHLPVLRETLEALSSFKGRHVVGFVTDEAEDTEQTAALLRDSARRLVWATERQIRDQNTFLAFGAKLLKRDLIFQNRIVMRREHRLMEKAGFYDYPRFTLKMWLLDKLLGLKLRKPRARRAFYRSLPRRLLGVFENHVEIGAPTASAVHSQPPPVERRQAAEAPTPFPRTAPRENATVSTGRP